METISNSLFRHIAISVALPEVFYNFRIFTKSNDYVKTIEELEEELCLINYKEFTNLSLNKFKIDSWHFERMIKIYKELSLNGHMKFSFNEILERLENNQFDNAEKIAKEIFNLIENEKVFFTEVYNEENFVSLNLEMFVEGNRFDWKEFSRCVSIVTITLENLLLTHLISPPSHTIKLNLINLEKTIQKLNLNEIEIDTFQNKLNDYSVYFSHKTSLKLSKERGSIYSEIVSNYNIKNEELNWTVLLTDIKFNGLRNQIEIIIPEQENIEIVETPEVSVSDELNLNEKDEVNENEQNLELDYYFSRPKNNKMEIIDEEEMAPIIKGMRGAKEMCPLCFSLNVSYISGCMCCSDCGWSACSLS